MNKKHHKALKKALPVHQEHHDLVQATVDRDHVERLHRYFTNNVLADNTLRNRLTYENQYVGDPIRLGRAVYGRFPCCNPGALRTNETPTGDIISYINHLNVLSKGRETWVVTYLLNEDLGGKGQQWNLVPLTKQANQQYLEKESVIKAFVFEEHEWHNSGFGIAHTSRAEYGRSDKTSIPLYIELEIKPTFFPTSSKKEAKKEDREAFNAAFRKYFREALGFEVDTKDGEDRAHARVYNFFRL